MSKEIAHGTGKKGKGGKEAKKEISEIFGNYWYFQ